MSRYLHHISGKKTEIESRNEMHVPLDINPNHCKPLPNQNR